MSHEHVIGRFICGKFMNGIIELNENGWKNNRLVFDFHLFTSQSVTLCVCVCVLQGRAYETDSNQEGFVHADPGDVKSFLDAVNVIKPTAIIGMTGRPLSLSNVHLLTST